ncbi:hypothetical protein AURDEDRAFT_158027 [Auricularia subglabra TFB-10046 SS5]|nr:hypothetical protein AURDEDRAFT_158027 [Auricularia subglabra TFB-10046 SS5]
MTKLREQVDSTAAELDKVCDQLDCVLAKLAAVEKVCDLIHTIAVCRLGQEDLHPQTRAKISALAAEQADAAALGLTHNILKAARHRPRVGDMSSPPSAPMQDLASLENDFAAR